MPRLDLDDLSLFRHVAEAGSITRGAARAHLALSAASTRLRGMEAALRTALLDRGRLGVTLTPAGHRLLAHARALGAAADRMHEEMATYAGDGGGHIRLLSNTNALDEFLPDALGRFLVAHPGVTVDLRERLSDEIVRGVAEGAAELGIVAGTVDTGTLRTVPFRSDRFVLVLPVRHPLAARADVGFAAVLDQEFVGLDRGSALQRFVAARAAEAGHRLRLRVQLRSFDAVCRVVAAGVGVGVVPETTARRAANSLPLAVLPLRDPWAVRDLRVCLRDPGTLSAAARDLLAFLAEPAGAAGPRFGVPGTGPGKT